MSSHVDDFNTRNKVLTAKLLRQGYRYYKLRKVFSKFYRQHFDLVSKYNVELKTQAYRGLTGWSLLLRIFSVAVSPHISFILRFNFDFYELGILRKPSN